LPEVGKEQRVDNRSYDPDQQPDGPIEPTAPTTADSHIIGKHHEMPTPIDPASGIAQDLSVAKPQSLEDPAGFHYHTYSEVGATPDNTPVAHGGLGPEIPPAQHVAPSGYVPGPGMPPPAQGSGKGFPWLPCCGVTCGLLLVITLVFVFVGVKYFKPLINAGIQLGNISEEVKTEGAPDTAEITVTAQELSANGAQYENQWVELTGRVADDPGPSLDTLRQKRGMQDSTGYVIDPNIIVLDVTNAEQKAQQGETIRVIGKPVILDFEMLGPTVAKQIEQDAELGDVKQLVFLITDDVQVVEVEESPEVMEDTAERET
jgi:hypothetical protein